MINYYVDMCRAEHKRKKGSFSLSGSRRVESEWRMTPQQKNNKVLGQSYWKRTLILSP
ncbi:hypothetical protein I7I48_01702 [Histoplasma ohiense]|nr:hypothetical protein I7I48_01702 [Histoplasma ohiense (nom. inval.)]